MTTGPLHRSGELVEQAMELFDQADDIERTAREGGDVTVMGRTVRGEEALNVANRARFDLQLPLMASLAINAERIANALEAANSFTPDEDSLDRHSTTELIAEVSRRVSGGDDGE
jgi:hypothetical protein